MCHYKKRNFPVAAVIETAQAVPITGNFETSGSKFSNETRFREAACVLCYKSEIPFLTPLRSPFYDGKQKRNFPVAAVIETALAVPITGNFETLGSKFSHETAGLLASLLHFGNSISISITFPIL